MNSGDYTYSCSYALVFVRVYGVRIGHTDGCVIARDISRLCVIEINSNNEAHFGKIKSGSYWVKCNPTFLCCANARNEGTVPYDCCKRNEYVSCMLLNVLFQTAHYPAYLNSLMIMNFTMLLYYSLTPAPAESTDHDRFSHYTVDCAGWVWMGAGIFLLLNIEFVFSSAFCYSRSLCVRFKPGSNKWKNEF